MMNRQFPKILKLGTALFAGTILLGCQVGSLVPTGLPKSPASSVTAAPKTETNVPSAAVLPQVEVTTQPATDPALTPTHSEIMIAIKWPERPLSIQAIPLSANSLRVRISAVDGGEDLYNELIGRNDAIATPDPNNPNIAPQAIVRKYMLKKDVPYEIEVKVYKENVASVTEASEAIAFTENPEAITLGAGETQAVKLVLKALYTPTAVEATYGAGSGATVVIQGSGFGTSKSLIKAEWVKSDWDKSNLEVLSVTDTAVTLKMPNVTWGAGPLNIYRDGVKANGTVALHAVNNFDFPADDVLKIKRATTPADTFYAIAGHAFPLTLNRADGKNFTNLVYSVKVKNNETMQDVTATVLNDGQFTLPDGKYTVTFTSGALTKDITIETGTLTWVSNPTFVVAPYYIPGILSANKIVLTEYYLTLYGQQQALFNKSDFTWGITPAGRVMADPDQQWEQNNYSFKAAATAGTATVTGMLRFDTTQTIQATVTNVRIDAINLQQTSNWDNWMPTWSTLTPGASLSLNVGDKMRLRVNSLALTNTTTKNNLANDWTLRDKLEWETFLPDSAEPGSGDEVLSAAKTQSQDSQTDVTLTANAVGSVTLRAYHKDDPTKFRDVTIQVTAP